MATESELLAANGNSREFQKMSVINCVSGYYGFNATKSELSPISSLKLLQQNPNIGHFLKCEKLFNRLKIINKALKARFQSFFPFPLFFFKGYWFAFRSRLR
jgi:hypothetical protein